jgi:hypothetical protein
MNAKEALKRETDRREANRLAVRRYRQRHAKTLSAARNVMNILALQGRYSDSAYPQYFFRRGQYVPSPEYVERLADALKACLAPELVKALKKAL